MVRPLLPLVKNSPSRLGVHVVRSTRAFSAVTIGAVPPIGSVGESSSRYAWTIIAVLPEKFGKLSPNDVMAMISNGSILFTSARKVVDDVSQDAGLTRYVSSVTPLQSVALKKEEDLLNSNSQLLAALLLSISALLGMSLANDIVYFKISRQRIKAQLMNGWFSIRMHWLFECTELLLVSAVIYWQYYRQHSYGVILANPQSTSFAYFKASLAVSRWAVPGAVAVSLISLLGAGGALVLGTRRILRNKF